MCIRDRTRRCPSQHLLKNCSFATAQFNAFSMMPTLKFVMSWSRKPLLDWSVRKQSAFKMEPFRARDKAVALHVDSVSTTKTADDLRNEASTVLAPSGRKRKLTEAEIACMVADSCASSHALPGSGSGITLHVRSGIMTLLQARNNSTHMQSIRR